ncbi:MAG TPA: hypothetical protein VGL56_01775 [Fimbriimonadaceae bacterium]
MIQWIVMSTLGGFCIIGGFCAVLYAFFMNVGVHIDDSAAGLLGTHAVANLDLLNQREMICMTGCTALIVGFLLVVGGSLFDLVNRFVQSQQKA